MTEEQWNSHDRQLRNQNDAAIMGLEASANAAALGRSQFDIQQTVQSFEQTQQAAQNALSPVP